MRQRYIASFITILLFAASSLSGQQAAKPAQTPAPAPVKSTLTFKSNLDLVLVDVIVRDKNNNIVKGLTQNDFEVQEDGKTQEIRTFTFQEISQKTGPVLQATMLSSMAGDKSSGIAVSVAAPKAGTKPEATAPGAAAPAAAAAEEGKKIDADVTPLNSDVVAGHRVIILLFDTSSMAPEDIQKASESAVNWVKDKMTTSDLVAVASIGSTLQILSDFKNDKDRILSVVNQFLTSDGALTAADVDSSTMSTDETNANGSVDNTSTVDQSAQELDSFNNDVRLRGIKTLCDNMMAIQQKKAILYFSSGMQRNGSDNQIELRAAENACSRSNTTINPIDARGLQAVVPGGSARTASRGGQAAFGGSAVSQQFTQLASQQETLQALAADTGGVAFTDSNDFGEAFTKVTSDISTYYLIGYSSTNAKTDGAFRRISVKLKGEAAKNAHLDRIREGYYADKDFVHTAKEDRETILQEQLLTSIPATDVPMFVSAGYFRLKAAPPQPANMPGGPGGGPGGPGGRGRGGFGGEQDTFYVPISMSVPGSAIPPSTDKTTTLDVRGTIVDERMQPVGTIKQTLTVPPSSVAELAAKQILYQTGVQLPPGRFRVRIVVRENETGQMGTFETPIIVPQLRSAPVKVSSVIVSTQLQNATGVKSVSPLIHDNIEIVPNLTHVFSRDQKLYFYYEVYDPPTDAGGPQIRTNLAFYKGKVKVYETQITERRVLDAPDRKAAIFEFEVDASTLKQGLYTCQVNIIDAIGGKFIFPRLDMYIRNAAAPAPAIK
jgi:VWFA-related protein